MNSLINKVVFLFCIILLIPSITLSQDSCSEEIIPLKEAQAVLKEVKKHSYKEPFLSWQEREWVVFLSKLSKLPVLEGILITDTDKKAILNGQSVKEGDIINEFTVLKIEREYVLLQKGKKSYKLSISQVQ